MSEESGRSEVSADLGPVPEGQATSAGGPDSSGESVDVAALRGQVEENRDKYLRAAAELENFRKRNAREVDQARKFGAERLASAIVPVRDSLEASVAVLTAESVPSADRILEAERATLRLLDQALEVVGVREIDPHGEPFDPTKHEAISVRPSATAEPSTVLEVVQKGYEIYDRLLRPARVIVSKEP
jgi:molecular chaperone GrpE